MIYSVYILINSAKQKKNQKKKTTFKNYIVYTKEWLSFHFALKGQLKRGTLKKMPSHRVNKDDLT